MIHRSELGFCLIKLIPSSYEPYAKVRLIYYTNTSLHIHSAHHLSTQNVAVNRALHTQFFCMYSNVRSELPVTACEGFGLIKVGNVDSR